MAESGDKTVVIFSGGLDSTTLLYHLIDAGHRVKALTINYGQRHEREISMATSTCTQLEIEQKQIDLTGLSIIFGRNALTDAECAVPEGTYAADNMQITTVPNRNMIFLSIAIGWAASMDFNGVAFGAHSGMHVNYPDCRPEFASAMSLAASNCHWDEIAVLSPFIEWTKADIVRRGRELKVPFEQTWSCYEGTDVHCGQCGTCIDRRNAFDSVSLEDPVPYRV